MGAPRVTRKTVISRTTVAELAEAIAVRDCCEWFGRNKRWIDEKHVELCRIPAPTFQEEERGNWMAGQLRELGFAAEPDRAGNIIARKPGVSGETEIAVSAHLDTVLAPRTPADIVVTGDGRLQGPGVSDNGAGLAALLAVAAGCQASGLPLPLVLLANVGEEGEGNLSGMRYLCESSEFTSGVRAFLVLDGPSTDHITSHAVASQRFEVVMKGPGGHSWSDFGTANPVHALSHAITLFSSAARNGDVAQSRSSFNIGRLEGGTSVNSIPDSALAKVDLRSEDPDRIREMAGLLSASVEEALQQENRRAVYGRLTARIRELGSRPAGRLADDAPLLQCLRAVDAHLGIRARTNSASTDANVPLSLGLEALSIGTGGNGGGAHTPSEWFDPHGREIGLRRIVLTLALLAGV